MNLPKLVDKYSLALEEAQKNRPQGGLCGFELEWNLLDTEMKPLMTVGSGPEQQSIVDHLRNQCLTPWLRDFSQLEVFHWMIEWATRPYYSPRAAVYEGRLLEAIHLNALSRAGEKLGHRLYTWHGNLLSLTPVDYDSIPGSWHIAKRRYLERCIDLYGDSLATAGTHSNLSLPDPLFTWDYLLLSPSEREDRYLDEYKSQFYITATRLMRAFCSMFIATSASTPLQAQMGETGPVVRLTEYDSVRNLTFPNPSALDVPDLYRSYQDYLRLSFDLVRRGVRFGNNNWTPVRARSFAEPVERLIDLTGEQLRDLYAHNLFTINDVQPMEEMARQIEIQNLMARIHLPMARIEVRTDDGGHTQDVDVANMTLKHLLLLRFYADSEFARAFRYDREDIARARRNEEAAARSGLGAQIENPLTGKPALMREFLTWTLEQVRPIAQAMETVDELEPLFEMAGGGPNSAELLRRRIKEAQTGSDEIPVELLCTLAEERQNAVSREVEDIIKTTQNIRTAGVSLGSDITRLSEIVQQAHQASEMHVNAPIRFRPPTERATVSQTRLEVVQLDTTGKIVTLAQELIRFPSVTTGPHERLDEVYRAAIFIYDYARDAGLNVHYFDRDKYPCLWITFPSSGASKNEEEVFPKVILGGHFDVVPPEPDESQFEPRLEGDYLWGRGSADMKTVLATYLVWMKDTLRRGEPYPPLGLLLVGNEENGESEPVGTPHAMRWLNERSLSKEGKPYVSGLFIAGERTGERGDELWGEICTQNRGVMRFEVAVAGKSGHSGTGGIPTDLAQLLFSARQGLQKIIEQRLTLHSPAGWQTQHSYPFFQVGIPGIYNITPDRGILGVEIRTIPQDDIEALESEVQTFCRSQELELNVTVHENGVACDPRNPCLGKLVEAVRQTSGQEPIIGRKLAGTSARFAPGGQGVVWGQTGLGPHSAQERHYLPSILPYYQALCKFGELLLK